MNRTPTTDERMKNAYTTLSEMNPMGLRKDYENYKQYLLWAKKAYEKGSLVAKEKIKNKKTRIGKLEDQLAKLQLEVSTLKSSARTLKDGAKSVNEERAYRRKINRLMKEHTCLSVYYEGDEDVFTTWVYSNRFGEDHDKKDSCGEYDPHYDNHFTDTYQEAYERCCDYISLYNMERNKQKVKEMRLKFEEKDDE